MLGVLLGAASRQAVLDRDERVVAAKVRQAGGWIHYRLRYRLGRERDGDRSEPQLLGDRTVIVVSLSGHPVDDRICKSLPKCRNLKRLYLDETGLTDVGMKQVGKLARLERLSVSNTSISDFGIRQIQGLERLQELNVSQTGITDQAVTALIRLGSLRRLVIFDTKISQSGVQRLRRACPSLDIFM
jgi:hypothetical protein